MSGSLKSGERFGDRYVVDQMIAEGGMASIYLALDERRRQRVAVKVLYPYYADNQVIRARFAEEGRIQQLLAHPNVVQVYEVLEEPLAIVMEHVDGPTLDDYLAEQGQLDEGEILDIAIAVMSALGLAHSRGIIHRDLKPSNILLRRGSRGFEPKVMDFGVAKVKDAKHDLTATGTTVGTLHYMSPEQIVGSKNIDGRADIYSLGVTLYKLATGEVPFNAPTEFALMMAQVEAPPLPPSQLRSDLSPELEQMILRAMAKKPADRFQTIREFITALLEIKRGADRTVRDTITETISQELIDMAMAADEVAQDRTGEMNLRVLRQELFAPPDPSSEPTVEMESASTRRITIDEPTDERNRDDSTVELSASQIIQLSADATTDDLYASDVSNDSTREMHPRFDLPDSTDSRNITRPTRTGGVFDSNLSAEELDTESLSQRVRMEGERIVVLDRDVGSRDLTAPKVSQEVYDEVMAEVLAQRAQSGPKVVQGFHPADTQDKTFEKPKLRTRLADFDTRKPNAQLEPPAKPARPPRNGKPSTERDDRPAFPPRPGLPPRGEQPSRDRESGERSSTSSSLIERVDAIAQSALRSAADQNIPQWVVVAGAFALLVALLSVLLVAGWSVLG